MHVDYFSSNYAKHTKRLLCKVFKVTRFAQTRDFVKPIYTSQRVTCSRPAFFHTLQKHQFGLNFRSTTKANVFPKLKHVTASNVH